MEQQYQRTTDDDTRDQIFVSLVTHTWLVNKKWAFLSLSTWFHLWQTQTKTCQKMSISAKTQRYKSGHPHWYSRSPKSHTAAVNKKINYTKIQPHKLTKTNSFFLCLCGKQDVKKVKATESLSTMPKNQATCTQMVCCWAKFGGISRYCLPDN